MAPVLQRRWIDVFRVAAVSRKDSHLLKICGTGGGKVGDDSGPGACRGLASLTPVVVCFGIAFSPCIVVVILSDTCPFI
jgi:hypothetical protein